MGRSAAAREVEYQLDFDVSEADWDDPLLPEVTSKVLGEEPSFTMTRTSLLAWSLMEVAHVQMADVFAPGG